MKQTENNKTETVQNHSCIPTTQHITAAVTYLILFMNTSWKKIVLANLTTSSKFEIRKLHTIISQLHHITTAKHFAATATF